MKIEENGAVYKVTMAGKFNPSKLREKMEKKLKKTVKLISPELDKEKIEIQQMYKCKEVTISYILELKSLLCFPAKFCTKLILVKCGKHYICFSHELNRFGACFVLL